MTTHRANIIKNVLGEYEILVAQSYDKALSFLNTAISSSYL